MKTVIIYGNRKQDPIVWDTSTPELRAQALQELFKYLDEDWQCYEDLKEPLPEQVVESPLFRETLGHAAERNIRKLYEEAKAGNLTAIEKLLTARRYDGEYEHWQEVAVKE